MLKFRDSQYVYTVGAVTLDPDKLAAGACASVCAAFAFRPDAEAFAKLLARQGAARASWVALACLYDGAAEHGDSWRAGPVPVDLYGAGAEHLACVYKGGDVRLAGQVAGEAYQVAADAFAFASAEFAGLPSPATGRRLEIHTIEIDRATGEERLAGRWPVDVSDLETCRAAAAALSLQLRQAGAAAFVRTVGEARP